VTLGQPENVINLLLTLECYEHSRMDGHAHTPSCIQTPKRHRLYSLLLGHKLRCMQILGVSLHIFFHTPFYTHIHRDLTNVPYGILGALLSHMPVCWL
jgi:hypothetical protein